MKRFSSFFPIAAFGVGLLVSGPVNAQSLAGTFILAEEGGSGAQAVATLGVLTLDGAGNVAGNEYVQSAGTTQMRAVAGTYTLASDGSGSMNLTTQVSTEDGLVPSAAGSYTFLSSKASGFVAIRRDNGAATLARLVAASSAKSLNGRYLLQDEGSSASGQPTAEIGLLQFKADGTLAGSVLVKGSDAPSSVLLQGAYSQDASGLSAMKLFTPGAPDEDGSISTRITPYVFGATAAGEVVAMRTDNSVLGLASLQPLQ